MQTMSCGRSGYGIMGAAIIDGKAIAEQVNRETAADVAAWREKGVTPVLAVVLVGDDPASQIYVRNKARTCERLGMESRRIVLPRETSQKELLALIENLNADAAVHGILVQFPLPPPLDERAVIHAISPRKDVDGFHPENVGRLLIGETGGFSPCTPRGVMELLSRTGFDPAGKFAVIIGRSNLVGKPLAAMLMQKARGADATVCCVHSGTPDPARFTRQADLLVCAVGKPEFVRGDMVKPGAVVIDVGINRVADPAAPGGSRVVGDVCFDEVSQVASRITPVPGGVGPMTIAMLMRNTVTAVRLAVEGK